MYANVCMNESLRPCVYVCMYVCHCAAVNVNNLTWQLQHAASDDESSSLSSGKFNASVIIK